jgi:ACS family tartrate transporter-like MFS transporter
LDTRTATLRKVRVRLITFLAALYVAAFIDRVNVSFAAGQMYRDLGLTAYVYGLGAGIFFLGYCLFEVPSNLILHRVGARRWIGRIMLTWAVIAGAMAFVKGPTGFCVLRFLLGVAEAGFFPGIVYYLTYWVPAADRARLIATFMTAVPLSTALAAPLSSAILSLDGRAGLAGWQWLFLTETLPSIVLGVAALKLLPDTPRQAAWLTVAERDWLVETLAAERRSEPPAHDAVRAALTSPRVLALAGCYFGAEIGLYGVILWVPQLFIGAGMAPGTAGYAVAIPYAIAAAGMVWWSRRSDRRGERMWHLAAASLVGFLGTAASALLPSSAALALLAVTVGATGTLAILPIFWTLPSRLLRGAAAAGGFALINSIGNVGGFVGPFVMGWIKTATGSYTWGLIVVAAGVLLTGILALLIGDRERLPVHNA